jgi:hypothetical protein
MSVSLSQSHCHSVCQPVSQSPTRLRFLKKTSKPAPNETNVTTIPMIIPNSNVCEVSFIVESIVWFGVGSVVWSGVEDCEDEPDEDEEPEYYSNHLIYQ